LENRDRDGVTGFCATGGIVCAGWPVCIAEPFKIEDDPSQTISGTLRHASPNHSSDMIKLSIVLPAYREKENLEVLIPQIEKEFEDTSIEIIVVDDNSGDGTRELMQDLQSRNPHVILLERPALLGIGSALRDGFNLARGEFILSSDADQSFSTTDMWSLFEMIQTGYDLVLGYRTPPSDYSAVNIDSSLKGRFENDLISPMSNFVIGIVSGLGFKNYNTNFRILRSSLWKSIKTVEDRQFFLFETIYRAKQKSARITEIPVTFVLRRIGESKVSFFRQAPKYVVKLLRIVFS
jgi:dolichol-phosphate mannosyltransferase